MVPEVVKLGQFNLSIRNRYETHISNHGSHLHPFSTGFQPPSSTITHRSSLRHHPPSLPQHLHHRPDAGQIHFSSIPCVSPSVAPKQSSLAGDPHPPDRLPSHSPNPPLIHPPAPHSPPSSSSSNFHTNSSIQSFSNKTSLSSLRSSLPESPHIYSLSTLRAVVSAADSGRSWRCNLHGKDAIVFRRKLRRSIQLQDLFDKLSVICRSHHSSIIKLLGASVSGIPSISSMNSLTALISSIA